MVFVPGVVVAEQVCDGNPLVGPAGEQSLKSDEAFGNKVAILDVPIEDVAKEIQMINRAPVSGETLDEGLFLRPLRRTGAAAKVHVGNE